MPELDWENIEQYIIYYPVMTIFKDDGLSKEYKQGKKGLKGGVTVTKSKSKLKSLIKAGKTRLILVAHGADGDPMIGANGLAKKNGAAVVADLKKALSGGELELVTEIWVWTCFSGAMDGPAAQIKSAWPNRDVMVYGCGEKVGNAALWIAAKLHLGEFSFRRVDANREDYAAWKAAMGMVDFTLMQ